MDRRPGSIEMQRGIVSLVIVAMVAASCGGIELDSSPTPATSLASQAPLATPAPAVTPSPTTRAPAPVYPWEEAGGMALRRGHAQAVLLGDGRVLVVGNEESGCVRDDTVQTELWDPATGTWTATASLNQPRGGLTAVALADGRALLVGGANAGDRWQRNRQAYSSTWLFDPWAEQAAWTKTGLLHAARISPATVVLADDRALVLGGYFASGRGSLGGATTVVWHPGEAGETLPIPPGDVDPGPYSPALATAELYSPTAGEWKRTGAMRFARIGPAATRLADGRVLVVGSHQWAAIGDGWTRVDDRAPATAELFDPATGTFTFLGRLPDVDWSPIADVGKLTTYRRHLLAPPYHPERSSAHRTWTVAPVSQLVALPDGDALLVEAPWDWSAKRGLDGGRLVRLLRFHADAASWSVVDRSLTRHASDEVWPLTEVIAGHVRFGVMLAVLPDGRVLFAGGMDATTIAPSDEADLYDPAADNWTSLSPMPEIRAGGAVVSLPDGSVLLVGGLGRIPTTGDVETDCGEGRTGLASVVRYVPSR